MNAACVSQTSATTEGRTYTNESYLPRALLPERFESTSVPKDMTGGVVEAELSEQYAIPSSVQTPLHEVAPERAQKRLDW